MLKYRKDFVEMKSQKSKETVVNGSCLTKLHRFIEKT